MQIPVNITRYLFKRFETKILLYSGGTDSTLLLSILNNYQLVKGDGQRLLDDLDFIVFNNTRMEFPETISYIRKVLAALKVEDKLVIIKPTKTRKELEQMIKEDLEKARGKKHDKSLYRCCYYSKKKPMKNYLKEHDLDKESTVMLRGLRAVESSVRMMSTLQQLERGHFYCFQWKHTKNAYASDPIRYVNNQEKKKWLLAFCNKYKIDYPSVTGCSICPIFYKYANKREQKTEQYRKMLSFFGQDSIESFIDFSGVESET